MTPPSSPSAPLPPVPAAVPRWRRPLAGLARRLTGWMTGWLASGARPAVPARDPRFDAVFGHAHEGILICDDHGHIVECNAAGASILALAPRSIAGRAVTELVAQAGARGLAGMPLRTGDAVAAPGRGSERPVELRVEPVDLPDGRQWVLHLRDRGEHRAAQQQLAYLANFDGLTGLPNRAMFRDRLEQAMARARRTGQMMALMFLDLDRFKYVNDSLGHEQGDRLLEHVADTLGRCLRSGDSVARLIDERPFTLSRPGGDEFTVIVESVESIDDAAMVARRMIEALNMPVALGEHEVVVSASIGISVYPTDGVDLDALLRHTDMAMYRAKSLGGSTYSFFSDDLNSAVAARVSLEGSLRRAIDRSEFLLNFQPKADLQTGEVTGVEALLRWRCPGHGMVPPDRFIGVLEDTGMILPVGAWVIRSACAQLAEWDRSGLPPIRMAVNLSARQLRHPYLVSMIEDTLRENYIHPRRLEIELTESLLMEDNEVNRGMLEAFARVGVRLAIDDFGTGHSSLSYLKRFNVDTLKIDRSFVAPLPDSSEDEAIATAVIALGRSMGMKIVAEGVETQAQADLLRSLGCNEQQGYLLGRPMPGADLAAWLRKRVTADQLRRHAYHEGDGVTVPMLLLSGAEEA